MNKLHLSPNDAANKIRGFADECEAGNYHSECASLSAIADYVDDIATASEILVTLPTDLAVDGVICIKVDPALKSKPHGVVDHILYVHGDKERNYSIWEDELHGEDDEAAKIFAYTALEVSLHCKINMDTGSVSCYAVNGVDLNAPVPV